MHSVNINLFFSIYTEYFKTNLNLESHFVLKNHWLELSFFYEVVEMIQTSMWNQKFQALRFWMKVVNLCCQALSTSYLFP